MYNNRISMIGDQVSPDKNKPRVVFLDVKPVATPDNQISPSNGLFQPRAQEASLGQAQKDIFFENVKPVIFILRAMGALPISRPQLGISTFNPATPAMLYSVLIFLSMVGYIGYISMHKIRIQRSAEGSFVEAVIGYLFKVYLFPIVVVPIIWYETKKIADVFNSWSDFEICYKKVSRRPLNLNLRNRAIIISILIPILSTASVFITHLTMVHFKIIHVVPYVFLEVLTYILGGYWYLLCEALSMSATVLADDFQEALKHIGPAALVSEYRALWLRLSKLARDTGVANCYSFTFINLYLFLIITLSIYGLMSQISEGFGMKDIGLGITACYSICLLFFICDEAHYASHNVRTNFQKKLLTVELSWMNSDAQTEVNMFLRATEMNPSSISLGGFFDVNRNLFKSLLATMVTYLVVLLQFQISIPGDQNAASNVTDDNYDY